MDHQISDQEMISRLRSANDDARFHIRLTLKMLVESRALLRFATVLGSPLISPKSDGLP